MMAPGSCLAVMILTPHLGNISRDSSLVAQELSFRLVLQPIFHDTVCLARKEASRTTPTHDPKYSPLPCTSGNRCHHLIFAMVRAFSMSTGTRQMILRHRYDEGISMSGNMLVSLYADYINNTITKFIRHIIIMI